MSLKTRRFIFYNLLFLFIITGFGVIFYSQGWRIDIKDCRIFKLSNCSIKFQKTGAIFIETKPKGVTIKIDNKIFQDESGLIQSGTLIDNLSPKIYNVEIEKDGYLPWEKNVSVESGLVTEMLKIVLIPEKLKKENIPISKSIDNFWINSQQKIVFKNKENLYFLQESSALPIRLKGNKFILWSEDNNKIIVQDSKNQTYYLYELNNLSKALNINATLNNLQKTNIIKIAFHPFESNRLIISTEDEPVSGKKNKNNFLYVLDTNRLKLEAIIKEPVIAWTTWGPNLYYIRTKPNTNNTQTNANNQYKSTSSQYKSVYALASFNLTAKANNFVFELPNELISQEQEISKINVSGNKIALLTKNGDLYLFNKTTQSFNQIAHSVEKFAFSPDNKKIAFLDRNGKLNIYFLENYQRGIKKKADEVVSLNFYEGFAVKNIFWYKDSCHLFIEHSNSNQNRSLSGSYESASLDFIEIDDRLPINKYTLFEGISNLHYESELDRLCFIQENSLYFAEF